MWAIFRKQFSYPIFFSRISFSLDFTNSNLSSCVTFASFFDSFLFSFRCLLILTKGFPLVFFSCCYSFLCYSASFVDISRTISLMYKKSSLLITFILFCWRETKKSWRNRNLLNNVCSEFRKIQENADFFPVQMKTIGNKLKICERFLYLPLIIWQLIGLVGGFCCCYFHILSIVRFGCWDTCNANARRGSPGITHHEIENFWIFSPDINLESDQHFTKSDTEPIPLINKINPLNSNERGGRQLFCPYIVLLCMFIVFFFFHWNRKNGRKIELLM